MSRLRLELSLLIGSDQSSEAGIDSSLRSIRSAVASRSWLDDLPVQDILDRGNSKCSGTFKKHYYREVSGKFQMDPSCDAAISFRPATPTSVPYFRDFQKKQNYNLNPKQNPQGARPFLGQCHSHERGVTCCLRAHRKQERNKYQLKILCPGHNASRDHKHQKNLTSK